MKSPITSIRFGQKSGGSKTQKELIEAKKKEFSVMKRHGQKNSAHDKAEGKQITIADTVEIIMNMEVPSLWQELFKVWKMNHFECMCRSKSM